MRWAPGEWSELAGIPLLWLLMTSLPFASVRGNVNLFRNFGLQSTRDLIFASYHNRHLAILTPPPPLPLGWSVWESCDWVQGGLGTGDKLMGERRSERACQLSSLLPTEWTVDSQEQAVGLRLTCAKGSRWHCEPRQWCCIWPQLPARGLSELFLWFLTSPGSLHVPFKSYLNKCFLFYKGFIFYVYVLMCEDICM